MTSLTLRDVEAADVAVFLRHQFDAEANRMAGSTPRTEADFLEHWARTSRDPANRRLTVLCGGVVAGYVGSFPRSGQREVCYWLGREFWGQGLATRALAEFLKSEPARPLYARVAKRNPASMRVVEKCGFEVSAADRYSNPAGELIEELVYRLER